MCWDKTRNSRAATNPRFGNQKTDWVHFDASSRPACGDSSKAVLREATVQSNPTKVVLLDPGLIYSKWINLFWPGKDDDCVLFPWPRQEKVSRHGNSAQSPNLFRFKRTLQDD